QRDEEAMHMKDRQRVQQHIARMELPVAVQRDGVGGEIVMAQRRAFRAPGRARRIEDGGKIVFFARDGLEGRRKAGRAFDQRAIAALIEGEQGLDPSRSEEHTSELQSRENLVCRLLLEKKK